MTLAVLASVTGSPGVTTTAIGLASAWPQADHRVLLEADPDGGRLGAELGVGLEPGFVNLALEARSGALTALGIVNQTAAAVGDWRVVPGPASGEQARSMIAAAAEPLAATMSAADDVVWLVDGGRLDTRSPVMPMAIAADHVVLVCRGSLAHLQLLPHRVDTLAQAGCAVSSVIVGDPPWKPSEIAGFIGCDVLTVVPHVNLRKPDLRHMRHRAWRPWWTAIGRLVGALRLHRRLESL